MGSWHESRLRVRFEETDRAGIVYYAKFFIWMEVGRVNLLRDAGFAPKEWDDEKVSFPVVQAHADYRDPARFDDEILVKTRVEAVGRSSIRFGNEVHRLDPKKLLCTGHTVHVLVDVRGKPLPFPPHLRERLTSS
jgi:acyl-CoA thioester hydrolase